MSNMITPQVGYLLNIKGEYHNTLDIEGFSQMMKDPSFCYKFYWLEAIVDIISEGIQDTTFDAIIDEMICNAWYSVREFHIHLSGMPMDGNVKDGLERTIDTLAKESNLSSNASKIEIKNAIKEHNDKLKKTKNQLTHMVPVRALSGFFARSEEEVPWESIKRLTEYIQRIDSTIVKLPYTFGKGSGLKKEVHFDAEWMRMIQDNTVNILGWIQYEKVKWLQNNNPEVPGLIYKLAPLDEKSRKLDKVRKLWNGILDVQEVRDVFTGASIVKSKYDVDHFIPWSFVMNDELWNLMPMDSSSNSSKSNKLPQWDPFFGSFAENQYRMYKVVQEREGLYKLFADCYRDNLHSIWAGQELYRSGNTREEFYNILQKNMQPVYDSARRQGYEIWGRS